MSCYKTYIPYYANTHTFLIPFVIKEAVHFLLPKSVPLFVRPYFLVPSQELSLSESSNSLKSIPSQNTKITILPSATYPL